MLLQTSLSQISIFMQIFITVKESFFWKGIQQWIQQIDYCNKTFKETNQRQSVFGSSHWELDRYSELFFLFRISEKYLWKRSFLTMLQAVDLQFYLKKESLSRHFSRILPIDSVGKIKEQLVLRKPFQPEQFQSIVSRGVNTPPPHPLLVTHPFLEFC